MKIAILFHGHLRSFRNTKDSFDEKVLNSLSSFGFEHDTFIHTWDKEEFLTKTWHEGAKTAITTSTDEVKKAYKPKGLSIEKQELKNTKDIFGRPYDSFKSYWYSLYQAFMLMKNYEEKNQFKYDSIIVTRPDVQYFSNIFLSEIEKQDTLWQCQVYTKRAASDVLFYGNRDTIEKSIVLFYENFDDLHSDKNVSKYVNNEYIFNDFISFNCNVRQSKYCMPRDWRILRSWWKPTHAVGHKKWDKNLCEQDIKSNNKYKFYRHDK